MSSLRSHGDSPNLDPALNAIRAVILWIAVVGGSIAIATAPNVLYSIGVLAVTLGGLAISSVVAGMISAVTGTWRSAFGPRSRPEEAPIKPLLGSRILGVCWAVFWTSRRRCYFCGNAIALPASRLEERSTMRRRCCGSCEQRFQGPDVVASVILHTAGPARPVRRLVTSEIAGERPSRSF